MIFFYYYFFFFFFFNDTATTEIYTLSLHDALPICMLSVLCARAAGTSYEEVLRTRVFQPLGMRETGFHTEDVARLATAYQPTADGLVVWDPPDGQWSRPPAFHDGAAGLVSTVDDLLAFARMLLRGGDQVLTADQVREMSRDHLSAEQREFGTAFLGRRGWGLGIS